MAKQEHIELLRQGTDKWNSWRKVLFPIRLDDTVLTTTHAWAAGIRRQRHIGDFTVWKDHDAYQQAFDRLVRDLRTSTTNPKT